MASAGGNTGKGRRPADVRPTFFSLAPIPTSASLTIKMIFSSRMKISNGFMPHFTPQELTVFKAGRSSGESCQSNGAKGHHGRTYSHEAAIAKNSISHAKNFWSWNLGLCEISGAVDMRCAPP